MNLLWNIILTQELRPLNILQTLMDAEFSVGKMAHLLLRGRNRSYTTSSVLGNHFEGGQCAKLVLT